MNSFEKLLTRQNQHEIRLCEQYGQYEQFFLHVRAHTRDAYFSVNEIISRAYRDKTIHTIHIPKKY